MAAALANTLFRRSVHSAPRAASLARASFVPTCVKKSLVARPFSSTILRESFISENSRQHADVGIAQIKKYTEDHEWIDVSEDGQVGRLTLLFSPHYLYYTYSLITPQALLASPTMPHMLSAM